MSLRRHLKSRLTRQLGLLLRYFHASYGGWPYIAVQCGSLLCLIAMLLCRWLKPTFFIPIGEWRDLPDSICMFVHFDSPPQTAKILLQDHQHNLIAGDELYLIPGEEYDEVIRQLADGNLIHIDGCPYPYFQHLQQGLVDGVLKFDFASTTVLPFKDVTRYDTNVSSRVVLHAAKFCLIITVLPNLELLCTGSRV